MSQKNFTQGFKLNSNVIDEIQEIYKKLGIPLNGMSKELYCHSEASCAAI